MENLNFTQPQDELSEIAWNLLLRKDSNTNHKAKLLLQEQQK